MSTSMSPLSQFKEKLQMSNASRTPAPRENRAPPGAENVPPKSESTGTQISTIDLSLGKGQSSLLVPRYIERRKQQSHQQTGGLPVPTSSTALPSSSLSPPMCSSSICQSVSHASSVTSLPCSQRTTTPAALLSTHVSTGSSSSIASRIQPPIRFNPNALLEDSDSEGNDQIDGPHSMPSQHNCQGSCKSSNGSPWLSSCRDDAQHNHLKPSHQVSQPRNLQHHVSRNLYSSPPLAIGHQLSAGQSNTAAKTSTVMDRNGVVSTITAPSFPLHAATSAMISNPSDSEVAPVSSSRKQNCSAESAPVLSKSSVLCNTSCCPPQPVAVSVGSGSACAPVPAQSQQVVTTVAEPTHLLSQVTLAPDHDKQLPVMMGHAVQVISSADEGHHATNSPSLPTGVLYELRQPTAPVLDDCFAQLASITVKGKQYLQLSAIGKGGCGKVYRGLSTSLDLVAIKHVDIGDVASCEDQAVVLQSCLNEIAVLEQLQSSDHIVKLHSWELSADRLHIHMIMECGEYDLASFMSRQHQYLPHYIDVLWKQMVDCVKVIHAQRIVHSDLKPANFVFFAGVLKLIDFGIAGKLVGDVTSISRDVRIGTPNYMAPECIRAKNSLCKANPKSDVWSLGCILYRMVYNKTPFHQFTDPMMKFCAIIDEHQEIPFPPLQSSCTVSVLKQCLTRDLAGRASVEDLISLPLNFSSQSVPSTSVVSSANQPVASVSTQPSAEALGSTAPMTSKITSATGGASMQGNTSDAGTHTTPTVTTGNCTCTSSGVHGSSVVSSSSCVSMHNGKVNTLAASQKREGSALATSLPPSTRPPLQASTQGSNVLQFLTSLEQRKGVPAVKK